MVEDYPFNTQQSNRALIMQQHELNGKKILLVSLPSYAFLFLKLMVKTGADGQSYLWSAMRANGEWRKDLPPGDWKFFAFTDLITEAQAAELVECSMYGYRDYQRLVSGFPFGTAKESFQSWLTANNISGNHALLVSNEQVFAKCG